MKARVRIELPPGADSPGARAALVRQVAGQLGVDVHVHGPECGCESIEKAEREVKELRHRAPQEAVERSTKVYEQLTAKMIEDVVKILAE